MSEGARSVKQLVRERNAVLDKMRRREILDKYARIGRNGKPALCGPPDEEHRRVIFNTAQDAERAVREFRQMGSTRPQYVEVCPRSRRGHHHIVGRPTPAPPQEPTTKEPDTCHTTSSNPASTSPHPSPAPSR